jgi:hemerythrin
MALFDWNDSFSVGVTEVDTQHKKLFKMINDLHAAMQARKGQEVVGSIIKDLRNYTQKHFGYEETKFDEFNYPDKTAHKLLHTQLIKKVNEFADKIEKGESGVATQLSIFLNDWLKSHIQGTDKKYGPFFNEKGLK